MPIQLPPLSRREFVRRTMIAGAGWVVGARLQGATPATDEHRWALLSDPHLAADRAKEARGINMAASVEAVVADVLKQPRRPAAALVQEDPSGIHLVNLPATGCVFDAAQPAGWVSAMIEPRGMRLELRCVDSKRVDHGQTVNLAWRA